MKLYLTSILLQRLFPLPPLFLPTLSLHPLAFPLQIQLSSQCLGSYSATPTPVLTAFAAAHWPLISLASQQPLNRQQESPAVLSSDPGTE